ncbi:unnamed protein product [Phytophthora lilii]|uniref:Unnamed protein product n=1 Tax=Phytophthora lilii TaxID=2077276 RepID=A0A9W6X2E7_9STRA|nr:unnamed protein product [Phytophthora lilii]
MLRTSSGLRIAHRDVDVDVSKLGQQESPFSFLLTGHQTEMRQLSKMKLAQVGAVASTLAALSTLAYGYSFSDVSTTNEAPQESTGLTTNEESRIYGGTEGNIDKYPFLASLRDAFFEETFCGGTLIAPQYILTAGHCIKTDEMDIVATFGTNESTGSGSGAAVTVPVIKGFRHPLYKKKEHLYDVGLLKLEKPVKRKTAKLCAVDGSNNKVGTMATVLGWGKTEESGDDTSPILQQLTIPVISNAECGKFKKYIGRVTDGMLCAGTGNGKDTCNGDSGGPLLVNGDILIGCVSWGSKCGEQAGIYTRLTYVMDYIEDILAGGDGSKFNVTSSSSGSSMEEVSLPSSSDKSSPDESSESASGSVEQSTPATNATKKPSKQASKAPAEESSASASGVSEETSKKATKEPVEDESTSSSGSSEEVPATKASKATKGTKATKAQTEDSLESSSDSALQESPHQQSPHQESPYQQTVLEDDSTSTSASESASNSDWGSGSIDWKELLHELDTIFKA